MYDAICRAVPWTLWHNPTAFTLVAWRTAMNIVHLRVKPGREADFIASNQQFVDEKPAGARKLWVIKTGERSMLTYLLHPMIKRMSAAMKEE